MNETKMAELKALMEQFSGNDASEENKAIGRKIVTIYAEEFQPEATALVKRIEADPYPTTQNGYGRYLNAITALPRGLSQLGFIEAMQNAGAGAGLNAAMKIIAG